MSETLREGEFVLSAGEVWEFGRDPLNDPINPDYYRRFPVEVIDITEHLSFNCGNAVKYAARAGFKDDAIQDLEKAKWYLEREIARLSK